MCKCLTWSKGLGLPFMVLLAPVSCDPYVTPLLPPKLIGCIEGYI